jgi:hypothetical protein
MCWKMEFSKIWKREKAARWFLEDKVKVMSLKNGLKKDGVSKDLQKG